MNLNQLEWEPGEKIGDLVFGQSLRPLIVAGTVSEREELSDKENEWRCFSFSEGVQSGLGIYVDLEDRIESVFAEEFLLFDGHNLIGNVANKIDEILDATPDEISEEPDIFDEERRTQIREYFELGLQLWIENGIVTGAFVGEIIPDDE